MTDSIQRVQVGNLQVAQVLHNFIRDEVLPGTGTDEADFWSGFDTLIHDLSPKNHALLAVRDQLQSKIDAWHQERSGQPLDPVAYKSFLQEIGYIVPEGEAFKVGTQNVDDEIANVAGPQLVVPVTNARFAVKAANARWESLYDSLYGTDAIPGQIPEKGAPYDVSRGSKVISYARHFLDKIAPLTEGTHRHVMQYIIEDDKLYAIMESGLSVELKYSDKFVGYKGERDDPSSVLLINNGLHVEIKINKEGKIGKTDPAGIDNIILEAATTTIVDLEDSVATVDADDKVAAYRNWLGLMKGDLVGDFEENGKTVTRRLNSDRQFIKPDATPLSLHGRSLMMVRNVGHLMMDDSILDKDGQAIPEGILDAMITSLIGLHDLKRTGSLQNSRTGSIYIVKPKQHGPEEVAFTSELHARVEGVLKLPPNTLKIGIMDEERRTTLNLKECIRAAKDRIFFINTGFLDRTGDEIHTSMHAGAMLPKGEMRKAHWMTSYENWNVDIGLECGLPGMAQIGKGMWAKPDNMAEMLTVKIGHPKAGANTAWVPSPTAGVLHALHYHQIDVAAVQRELSMLNAHRATIDDLLQIPLAAPGQLTPDLVQRELDNSCQSILGYVVRWVDQGVGCSKVPDIDDVKLMEDRATLRISSQGIANWLYHDICTPEQVMASLKRMAAVVDRQNAGDPSYKPMAPNFDGEAFMAAYDLVFEGMEQPNGYTEPLLYERRRAVKLQELAA